MAFSMAATMVLTITHLQHRFTIALSKSRAPREYYRLLSSFGLMCVKLLHTSQWYVWKPTTYVDIVVLYLCYRHKGPLLTHTANHDVVEVVRTTGS